MRRNCCGGKFRCGPGSTRVGLKFQCSPGTARAASKSGLLILFFDIKTTSGMELVLGTNEGRSVEECMKEAVKDLDPIGRLEAAIQVIEQGLESEERSQEVVSEVWELVLREEWWRARFGSVEGFKSRCGMTESVSALMMEREKRERLKRSWRRMIGDSWGEGELETMLGAELMPLHLSKHFLERIKSLAQVMDAEEAKRQLSIARDRRLGLRGASNDPRLRVQDIRAALEEFNGRGPTQASQIEPAKGSETAASQIDAAREEEGEKEKNQKHRGSKPYGRTRTGHANRGGFK